MHCPHKDFYDFISSFLSFSFFFFFSLLLAFLGIIFVAKCDMDGCGKCARLEGPNKFE